MISVISDSDEYAVNETFYLERLEKVALELDVRGEVCIRLGGTEESRGLNSQYRQIDEPTDVLSFLFDEDTPEGYYLGDIFICFPLAREQAEENSIPFQQEMFTLMLHGLMHLAGYDHETDGGEMLALQNGLLKKYYTDYQEEPPEAAPANPGDSANA